MARRGTAPGQQFVNRALLVVVAGQAGTGIASLLTGQPILRGVFDLHRVLAILFLLLLVFKLPVVWRSLTKRRRNRLVGLSLLLGGLILAANLLGWLVAAGLLPLRLPLGVTWLSVHVYLGLAALPLLMVHALVRWPLTRLPDPAGRRLVLLGLPALAFTLWIAGQRTRLLDRPISGAPRFTGSVPTTAFSGNDFPVTNWLFDDPDPCDPATWRLTLGGRVDSPLTLGYDNLHPETTRAAVLDCTGGWYTEQEWSGPAVDALLDRARARPDAAWVRFRSVTGHQTQLTIAEARACLLATHVGGEPLDHVHGAPVRLVAPDRRGVAWVKWLAEIEVL
ncbi:MAG TPA: molybdopterin-dependent oxidoreductase [Dehalococcoidia bacterium]|nr:molybdopterin-dependent oxidoreductase [Dehalococcoidia bacterium]